MSNQSIEEQTPQVLPVPVNVLQTGDAPPQSGNLALVWNLVKNSGIYALASFTAPFISLVLAPFLAHHLSGTDFGTLAVIQTSISLLAGVTQLGLSSAFFRAYNYDYESQYDRRGVISTVVSLLLLVSVPAATVVMLTSSWLSQLLFDTPSLGHSIRIAAGVVLLQNLAVPGLAWLRAESRASIFSFISITNLLVTLATNIVLVGMLHMGIDGALIATGAGCAAAACTLPLILLRAGVRLRCDIVRGLLAFGLPNVSNFVSVWVLQVSDRYLLSHFGTLAQTASYAVAYSFGSVLSAVVIAPFSLAWPAIMFTIAKRDDAARLFRLILLWFSLLLLFAAFELARIAVCVVNIVFPRSYTAATPLIPIIAASTLFYGLYIIFSIGISVRRKPWLAAIFTTISALANVALNLVLIRPYGPMGAALSTLLAYVLLAVLARVVNQHLYPIQFEMGSFVAALLVGVTIYLGSDFFIQNQGTYWGWGAHFAALCLYGGCLILFGKYTVRRWKNTPCQSLENVSHENPHFH